METNNEKTRREYVISEESRRLLSALDKCVELQDELLDALTFIYGEQKGSDFFNQETEKLQSVERAIAEYLRIQFTIGRRVKGEAVVI